MSPSPSVSSELTAKFHNKLKESGLTPDDARRCRFTLCTATHAAELLPGLPSYYSGFTIPYFSPDGRKNSFARFRYLDITGFAALVEKPRRYAQPKGSENHLYFSPLLEWSGVLSDGSQPLLITEGELKANAACRLGRPTVALGGVDSFRSQKHPLLLPDFDSIVLKGRLVYVVYDSDALTNPNIVRAENALAERLLQREARPHIVRLPALPELAKTGLDDYLVTRGTDALDQLLHNTEEWALSAELQRLNEEVNYCRAPRGCVVRRSDLLIINPRDFVEHAYSDRRILRRVPMPKGGVRTEEKSAAREWLNWPGRAKVERIVYAPGAPDVTVAGELNSWRGWGCEPKKGSTALWHQLLEHLTRGDPEVLSWIYDWMAFPLQRPGIKLYTCLVVWGLAHGTGKSFDGYILGDIYGANFREIGNDELFGRFNEWADERQLVMGTEITSSGQRHAGDRLKTIVTRERATIEKKFVTAYTVEDCCNYYFTSNHSDAFFIEDHDRRYTVVEVRGEPLPVDFYKRLDAWRREGGAAHLFAELLKRDIKNFDPRARAPNTRAKSEMIASSRSDIAAWAAELRENPDAVLLTYHGQRLPGDLWSSKELLELYDPQQKRKVTEPGLQRALSQAGFRKVNENGQVEGRGLRYPRLWAVGDRERLLKASNAVLFQQYTRELAAREQARKSPIDLLRNSQDAKLSGKAQATRQGGRS